MKNKINNQEMCFDLRFYGKIKQKMMHHMQITRKTKIYYTLNFTFVNLRLGGTDFFPIFNRILFFLYVPDTIQLKKHLNFNLKF